MSESPVLGTYRERPVPEWIDAPERGGRYIYDRIAMKGCDGSISLAQLRPDEFVVYPGLIYRKSV